MSKAVLALWCSLIGTAGSLFMAGWATHAKLWGIVAASGLAGIAGIACIGFMAWMFCLD